MICETCTSIFANSSIVDTTRQGKAFTILNSGVHHQTSADFLSSQQLVGCHICRNLYRALPQEVRQNLSQLDYLQSFTTFELFCPAGAGNKLTLSINYPGVVAGQVRILQDAKIQKNGHTFVLHPVSGYWNNEAAYSGLDLSSGTGTMRALSWATDWLQACNSSHSGCNHKTSSDTYYPRRLLEISVHEDRTNLRLCIRGQDQLAGSYAALSYCHSTEQHLELTTMAIDDMRMSIKVHELPKTFADSVQVCRALGIKYLWIGALCVIQDSKEDQYREMSSLAEIYRNSYLTIAATKSTNAQEGLFIQRNPFHYVRFSFYMEIKTTESEKQKYFIDDACYWSTRVESSPLVQQAPFIQERILSPRILHFAFDMMFWECRELSASEEFPFQIPFGRAENSKNSIPLNLTINMTPMDPNLPGSHRAYWGRVVRSYTQARLDDGANKLAAISGVAKQVHQLIKSTYLAGLWECSLMSDLLWQSEFPDESCRPLAYRAPSWSWASIDGAVFPGSCFSGMEIASLLDYKIVPESDDSYTKLKGVFLRLTGQLWPTRMRLKVGLSSQTDGKISEEFEPSKNIIIFDEAPKLPEGRSEMEATLYILPLVQCAVGQSPSRIGIALIAAEAMPQGYYRRVGLFKAFYGDQPGKMLGLSATEVPQSDTIYEEGKPGTICVI